MMIFPDSELPINSDGSAFHLHLKPEQITDRIILVGDPGRVDMISGMLDSVRLSMFSREFKTIIGTYKGKDVMALSTGIGSDNIDIVVNELDALANIDYSTRTEKSEHRTLTLVRVGTCGAIQEDLPVGTYLVSEKSVGMDGVLNYYPSVGEVSEADFEQEFCRQTGVLDRWARPYVVSSDSELVERIGKDMHKGVTITAVGFYAPQGRCLRGGLAHPDFNERLRAFRYGRYRITNYEMESSALEGMARMLGHKAMTVCLVVANRYSKSMFTDYHGSMEGLVRTVLDRI
ncbi:MAG: nucleoside phosphorylase [Bacteroidaceae bacterium]|nr:nucleoside phosphorylase [Bacteroidaceae bacterium]